jgi:regulator of protease activity HflC (stomatin/prohibitin superfamily)
MEYIFNYISLSSIITILIVILTLIIIKKGIKIVPQSDVYVIERFGKYFRTLDAGLSIIVPFLDRVQHKISILERQIAQNEVSVITKDNVEIALDTTVFFRIVEASASVYRIRNVVSAIETSAISIVRSAGGKLDLDEMQSAREKLNMEIQTNLADAAKIWGVEVTRTEITDVQIDEETKKSQRVQLSAERERRALVAKSEGEKTQIQLRAEAELYEAKKRAEGIRITAEAEAFSVTTKAKADATQTNLLAKAIADKGQPAVNFEIMKRQVDGLAQIASSDNSKTIIMPTDISKVIGSLETLFVSLTNKKTK